VEAYFHQQFFPIRSNLDKKKVVLAKYVSEMSRGAIFEKNRTLAATRHNIAQGS
jgi:hypothetical protein